MKSSKHILHVQWMHCKACVMIVQDTISEVKNVDNVTVNLKTQTVEIIYNNDEINPDQLYTLLNPLMTPLWYTLHTERPVSVVNWWEYLLAAIMAGVLIYGFIALQQLWLLDLLTAENRTYGTSFAIGLIASVSSCLAVVGGVVLALGTVYSDTKSFRPQSLFHVGRLVWFFLLWWILWLIGSAFQLSQTVSTILNMIIAVVLFVLWLNLLWIIRWWVTLGWGIFQRFSSKGNALWWPLLIGMGTFFLPCWFTQSMQIYTLSTGSFWAGGLTMLSFALGTLPILLLLSITWKSVQKSQSSGLFFKTIGIVLIVLALFNFTNSLVSFGIISPLFNI